MTRREISRYIRHLTPLTGKKCEICNTKKNIQCHHLIKVENLTHIAWHNGLDTQQELKDMYKPTVDLCNECHNNFHALMEENYIEPQVDYNVFGKIVDILQEIDLTQVDEKLYSDYRDVVDGMTDKIIFNLVKYGDYTEEELKQIEEIEKNLHQRYNLEFEEENSEDEENFYSLD